MVTLSRYLEGELISLRTSRDAPEKEILSKGGATGVRYMDTDRCTAATSPTPTYLIPYVTARQKQPMKVYEAYELFSFVSF